MQAAELRASLATDGQVYLLPHDPDPRTRDPAHADGWDEQRNIMGLELAAVLTDLAIGRAPDLVVHQELRIIGARVDGLIALGGVTLPCQLSFIDCRIGGLSVDQSHLGALNVVRCHLGLLTARQMVTDHNVHLDDIDCGYGIDLTAAKIGGYLDIKGELRNPNGPPLVDEAFPSKLRTTFNPHALNLHAAHVERDTRLRGIHVDGTVDLGSASIGGFLDLTGATIDNRDGETLSGFRLQVGESMFFGRAAKNETSPAGTGFTSTGTVQLGAAVIKGDLDMSGGTFRSRLPEIDAVDATGILVDRDIHARDHPFAMVGTLNLTAAQVGCNLDLGDLSIAAPESAATLSHPETPGHPKAQPDSRFIALRASEIEVGRDVNLETRLAGGAWLDRARIRGDLIACRTEFTGRTRLLNLAGATVEGSLWYRPPKSHDKSGVALLVDAHAHHFADSLTEPWPAGYRLSGFTYDSLPDRVNKFTVKSRLGWLNDADDTYVPQPYDHLAAFYRAAGHPKEARTVLVEKQRLRARSERETSRRVADTLAVWAREDYPALAHAAATGARSERARGFYKACWDGFVRATVGYGYKPLRILWWFLAALAAGTLMFEVLYPAHFEATEPAAHFQPLLYTLDLLLPVAGLHQRDQFTPDSDVVWLTSAFTLFGWLLSLILVAGLTGLFKRD